MRQGGVCGWECVSCVGFGGGFFKCFFSPFVDESPLSLLFKFAEVPMYSMFSLLLLPAVDDDGLLCQFLLVLMTMMVMLLL